MAIFTRAVATTAKCVSRQIGKRNCLTPFFFFFKTNQSRTLIAPYTLLGTRWLKEGSLSALAVVDGVDVLGLLLVIIPQCGFPVI
jgi:hypothetical protein